MSKSNKARERLKNFDPRGSNCPICKKEFRSDNCPHTVEQAENKLNNNIMREIVMETIAKQKAK